MKKKGFSFLVAMMIFMALIILSCCDLSGGDDNGNSVSSSNTNNYDGDGTDDDWDDNGDDNGDDPAEDKSYIAAEFLLPCGNGCSAETLTNTTMYGNCMAPVNPNEPWEKIGDMNCNNQGLCTLLFPPNPSVVGKNCEVAFHTPGYQGNVCFWNGEQYTTSWYPGGSGTAENPFCFSAEIEIWHSFTGEEQDEISLQTDFILNTGGDGANILVTWP